MAKLPCIALLLLALLVFDLRAFQQRGKPSITSPAVTFEDVTQKSGITWVHNNAQSVARHLPETVGAGCAFIDYDNDGWLDIFFVNSGASDFFTPEKPLRNALYRNN